MIFWITFYAAGAILTYMIHLVMFRVAPTGVDPDALTKGMVAASLTWPITMPLLALYLSYGLLQDATRAILGK